MKPVRTLHPAIGGLLLLLLLAFLLPPPAAARPPKSLFVDDDWDPIERSYPDDPGYEQYIEDALRLAQIDYDYYEIQPDDGTPQYPPLGLLAQYPLLLWNCAAETESTLTRTERDLIRDYMALGGKVMLLGQGILNDLGEQAGVPEVREFIEDRLGIADYGLDFAYGAVAPVQGIPYLGDLGTAPLVYASLPDPLPFFTDRVLPQPGLDSFLEGFPLRDRQGDPLSVDRFHPRPLHFQGFLMEAIPDPEQRGRYLRGLMEWLGLEGDELLDFMHGPDLLSPGSQCQESPFAWSAEDRAMRFSSWGGAPCESAWLMGVRPEPPACAWTIGMLLYLESVGEGSEMLPLELFGQDASLELRALPDPGYPDAFRLQLTIVDGQFQFTATLATAGAGAYHRLQLEQQDDPQRLVLRVADRYGLEIDAAIVPGYLARFDWLRMRTVACGHPGADPMRGLIDDVFFAGCLILGTTGAPEAPAAAAGPRLEGAWPNPFNPSTRLQIWLPQAGPARLAIFDAAGRRVRLLLDGPAPAGRQELAWNGRDEDGRAMASGLYLARLSTASGSDGQRLVLLK